jgi:drug/metabolite transporter (DMT)-like permease
MVNVQALNLTLSMVIFGTIGLFAVEGGLPAFATVFWRCVFASLFLAAWCVGRGYLRVRDLSLRLVVMAAVGGICNLGSSVALTAAYTSTTIATATIIYHVQPFFVVLIGALFLKETIRRHELLWVLTAFIGTGLATGLVGQQGPVSPAWAMGVALSLLAALLYAFGTILGKRLGDQRPEVTTLIQAVVAGVLLLPMPEVTQPVPMASWKWLICLGVIHTGIAYTLMFRALPELSTATIGVLSFIFPLVAILVDWLFYHQPIGPIQAAGMGLIMLGTLGVQLGWRLRTRKETTGTR